MNKYRKFTWIVLGIELLFILFCNRLCITKLNQDSNSLHRVEAKRVALELQNALPSEIDLSKYHSIVRIREFNPREICNNDYVVEEIQGKLFRIEYQFEKNYELLVYINVGLALVFIFTVLLLIYIGKKLLRPFHRMGELTYELAKGNLTVPIKEEKSKFFGRFLWGINMLREHLEEDKEKELELHKDKKTLILSLSHDIKTPLSAIKLYSKALSNHLYDTEEKQEEAYQGIANNIKEIEKYVNEITNASREDFLNIEVHLGEFYLSKVMRAVEIYYKEKLSLIHTEFILGEYSDCILKGDENRVIEVLQNIIENAIKYGDGKSIRIYHEEEEDCKLIYVENTGNSIKEEELPNLFDSFYRGSNSKEIKGSGLGLYICKNLMREMDGDVFAQIQEDKFLIGVVIRVA